MVQNNKMNSKEQKILQLKNMVFIRRSKIILVWLAILIAIGSILLIVGNEVTFNAPAVGGTRLTKWSAQKGGLWGGADPSQAGTAGQALFAVGTIGAVMLIISAILLITQITLFIKYYLIDNPEYISPQGWTSTQIVITFLLLIFTIIGGVIALVFYSWAHENARNSERRHKETLEKPTTKTIKSPKSKSIISAKAREEELELEKQKLELEKQKLELEKEKLKLQQQKSQK